MESGIQSSFIPQDATQQTRGPRAVKQSGLAELMLLVAIVLFVASAALAGAVFLYEQYVGSSSVSKSEQLRRAKEAFAPALIHDLTRLDDRMRAAESVLRSHMAPLAFFDALQISTLTTVSFKTLNLEVVDPQNMRVKMSGVAQGVNSIALQADLMSKNGVISNPIFSDINRQVDGVHFNLSAVLNPAAVNYVALLNAPSANAFPASQPAGAQPASPFGDGAATESSSAPRGQAPSL